MGGREEQAWRPLADHTQQAAEEIRPGPLLVGNGRFPSNHTRGAGQRAQQLHTKPEYKRIREHLAVHVHGCLFLLPKQLKPTDDVTASL